MLKVMDLNKFFEQKVSWIIGLILFIASIVLAYSSLSERISIVEAYVQGDQVNSSLLLDIRERVIRLETKLDEQENDK